MSEWTDTLEMLTMGNSSVVLFSTATTGLHKTDKLLAFSYQLYDGDTAGDSGTLFLDATAEELAPGMQYHQISSEIMRANALQKDEYKEKLLGILQNRVAFTYNAPFQLKALMVMGGGIIEMPPCEVCELPLWVKVGESKLHFIVDLPLRVAENQMANRVPVPTWKRMLEYRGLSSKAPPGTLPVTYNAECLARMYESLIEQPPDIEVALK